MELESFSEEKSLQRLVLKSYNKSGIVFGGEFTFSLMEIGTKGRDEVMIIQTIRDWLLKGWSLLSRADFTCMELNVWSEGFPETDLKFKKSTDLQIYIYMDYLRYMFCVCRCIQIHARVCACSHTHTHTCSYACRQHRQATCNMQA